MKFVSDMLPSGETREDTILRGLRDATTTAIFFWTTQESTVPAAVKNCDSRQGRPRLERNNFWKTEINAVHKPKKQKTKDMLLTTMH